MYKHGQIHNKKKDVSVNILQIERLSVNSITINFSLWVKVGEAILNLFIECNRVVVCSASSIVYREVRFLFLNSRILSQCYVAALFQYTFVGTSTANFKFVKGNVIAPLCFTTQT